MNPNGGGARVQEAPMTPTARTGTVKEAPAQAGSESTDIVSPPGTVNAPMVFLGTFHDTTKEACVTPTPVLMHPSSRCSGSATTVPGARDTELIRIGKALSLVTVTVRLPVPPGVSGRL